MSVKTHLADSAEPLVEGQKLLAICGAIVPDAAFAIQFDDGYTYSAYEAVLLMNGLCYRCKKSTALLKEKYLYGIRSGEEQKQTEAQ